MVTKLEQLLYFFLYVSSHNFQPFGNDAFVAKPILFCRLTMGHWIFFIKDKVPIKVVLPSTLIWCFNFELLKLHMFWNIMKNIDGIQWLHKTKTHQQNHTILKLILVCICEQGINKTIDSLEDMRNKEMK